MREKFAFFAVFLLFLAFPSFGNASINPKQEIFKFSDDSVSPLPDQGKTTVYHCLDKIDMTYMEFLAKAFPGQSTSVLREIKIVEFYLLSDDKKGGLVCGFWNVTYRRKK